MNDAGNTPAEGRSVGSKIVYQLDSWAGRPFVASTIVLADLMWVTFSVIVRFPDRLSGAFQVQFGEIALAEGMGEEVGDRHSALARDSATHGSRGIAARRVVVRCAAVLILRRGLFEAVRQDCGSETSSSTRAIGRGRSYRSSPSRSRAVAVTRVPEFVSATTSRDPM